MKKEILIPKHPVEFWTFTLSIPIFLSIIYFIINGCYKIIMGSKFNLPNEYFKIDLIKYTYNLILMTIPVIFLFLKKIKIINFLIFPTILIFGIFIIANDFFLLIFIFIILTFLFFGIIKLEEYLEIKTSLDKWLLRIFLTIEIIYYIFLKIINFIQKEYDYYLFSMNKYIYITGIIIIAVVFFAIYEYEIENEKSKIEINLKKLNFIYCLLYIIFSGITQIKMKTDYEILYQNGKEVRVIITTYEGNYLIADGKIDYDKDKNNKERKRLNIYTNNYKFIKIEEVENIKYIKFDEVILPPSK